MLSDDIGTTFLRSGSMSCRGSGSSLVLERTPIYPTLNTPNFGWLNVEPFEHLFKKSNQTLNYYYALPSSSSLATPSEYCPVLEWTVQCSWTVWVFLMFDMFEVQFWVQNMMFVMFKFQVCLVNISNISGEPFLGLKYYKK